MTALLEVRGLQVAYGHVKAVQGIDFDVPAGEIRTLVGSNGAGKSTTLLALSGLVRAQGGVMRFDGEDLSRLKTHQIVERGLVQVAEGRAILTTLTVRENLELGAYRRRERRSVAQDIERVLALFPRLQERIDALAGNLSGGEQQMLAIGRALVAKPRLLLLDEPSMGLAPQIVEEVFEIVRDLNTREGVTFLLAEQNTNMALRYADYGYILENGRIVMDGAAADLRENQDVKEFYLGMGGGERKSFKDVKSYKRRKRWLA